MSQLPERWLLVRSAELDLSILDTTHTVRVDVLQSGRDAHRFRMRSRRTDSYHLQPSLPLDMWSAPSADKVDEELLVRWPPAEGPPPAVQADSADAALQSAIESVCAAARQLDERLRRSR